MMTLPSSGTLNYFSPHWLISKSATLETATKTRTKSEIKTEIGTGIGS